MKKHGIMLVLMSCFLLSSCGYDTENFTCLLKNDNNDNIFMYRVDCQRKVGTDTGFIEYIFFNIAILENIDTTITLPRKVYVEKYEKEIAIYSLGGFTATMGPPVKSYIYVYIDQEIDLNINYNFIIDLNGMDAAPYRNFYAYAINETSSYKMINFTYDYINKKVK